jgi:type IV pilus assembly protein PilO
MAITLNDIKKIPPKYKALSVFAVYLLLGGAYFSVFMLESVQKKGTLETELSQLKGQVAEKKSKEQEKEKYIKEVNALKETLKIALTKLPDQREIPGLLYSIAQAGKDVDIDFILFEPKQSEKKPPAAQQAGGKPPDKKVTDTKPGEIKPTDTKGTSSQQPEEKFYEEIPVKVTVNGTFHSIVAFFEKVAKLPRIINIEDISMSGGKDIKGRGKHYIGTSCVIKTYMFLEKLEEKKADEKK